MNTATMMSILMSSAGYSYDSGGDMTVGQVLLLIFLMVYIVFSGFVIGGTWSCDEWYDGRRAFAKFLCGFCIGFIIVPIKLLEGVISLIKDGW